MKKDINKLFNLQGLLHDKLEFDDENNQIIVSIRDPKKFISCPNCSKSTKRIHGISYRKVKHNILDSKIVILNLKIRRLKCGHCGKIFTERIRGIDRRKTTANFRLQLLSWLQRNSISYIASRFKISPSTLVRYLLDINGDIKIDWSSINCTKIGIDEHSFRGKKMVTTITDLSNKKLLAILHSDSKEEIRKFLKSIPKKHVKLINEACSDLRSSFKSVIQECLPQAIHTADRFHVLKLFRKALDEIRTVVQEEKPGRKMQVKMLLWENKDSLNEQELKRLDLIFERYKNYPVLKQAWIIKEQVVYMYRASSEKEALKRYNHVMMLLQTPEYSKYLNTLKNTFKKWKVPILNYFKYKTTNGFTEGCHTKIKMIKRVSYGFKNINNYIAKITLAFLPLSYIISYHTL
jgi:transposase